MLTMAHFPPLSGFPWQTSAEKGAGKIIFHNACDFIESFKLLLCAAFLLSM